MDSFALGAKASENDENQSEYWLSEWKFQWFISYRCWSALKASRNRSKAFEIHRKTFPSILKHKISEILSRIRVWNSDIKELHLEVPSNKIADATDWRLNCSKGKLKWTEMKFNEQKPKFENKVQQIENSIISKSCESTCLVRIGLVAELWELSKWWIWERWKRLVRIRLERGYFESKSSSHKVFESQSLHKVFTKSSKTQSSLQFTESKCLRNRRTAPISEPVIKSLTI